MELKEARDLLREEAVLFRMATGAATT